MSERISDKMIAIDTEYHLDALGRIDNIFCICTSDNKGNHFKRWVSGTKDPNILNEIASFHKIDPKDMIIVVHAFDLAERRAFKYLGVENRNYNFICTYHLAKILQNSFSKKSLRVEAKNIVCESESEAITAAAECKRKKESTLSYAYLCKDILNVNIDTNHKEEMRNLCINNLTDGNEQQIMDYCADDTKYLIPLLGELSKIYYKCLYKSFCPLRPGLFDNISYSDCFNYLIIQCKSINLFGEIADKGLPIDPERCLSIKRNAIKFREHMKADFNNKYPGIYTLNKKGIYKENTKMTQYYMNELLESCKLVSTYPKSDKTGKWSMSNDNLKEYFDGTDTFAEHYRQLNKLVSRLDKVSKQDDNPLDYIIDDNLWYESLKPYESITSRCQPSTKRWVPGWHKSLYGILNPPKGKWLVELDLSSAETIIQAAICNDKNYHEIYQSKDIYLAFADKMRMINHKDWETLSVKELKDKYAEVRSFIKPMILGLSYGMGAKRLANRLHIPILKAQAYIESINTILHKSTQYKYLLGEKAKKYKAFSLPDGFICRTASKAVDNNHTTIGNWPFQSACAVILRAFVKAIDKQKREGNLNIEIVSTIHDALLFTCDAEDYETITKISNIMKSVSNAVLRNTPDHTMKVGEAEICKPGDIWTPEHKFDAQFINLLNYSE